MESLQEVLSKVNAASSNELVGKLLSVYHHLKQLPWQMDLEIQSMGKANKEKGELFVDGLNYANDCWTTKLGNKNDQTLRDCIIELIGVREFLEKNKDIQKEVFSVFDIYSKKSPETNSFFELFRAIIISQYSFQLPKKMKVNEDEDCYIRTELPPKYPGGTPIVIKHNGDIYNFKAKVISS